MSNPFEAPGTGQYRVRRPQAAEAMVVAEIAVHLGALRQHRLYAEECFQVENVIAGVAASMDAYDRSTACHQVRVAKIACAVARELGWVEEQAQALRVASLLHDVGKMSVAPEILNKPGRLNAEESARVRLHVEAGYAVLKDIPFPWPIAEVVRQHHERMDGSGYPRGLKGDKILPMARVLAVADVLDGMTSARSYRPALELEVVLVELESQADTLLDAETTERCVSLFREKKCKLPS